MLTRHRLVRRWCVDKRSMAQCNKKTAHVSKLAKSPRVSCTLPRVLPHPDTFVVSDDSDEVEDTSVWEKSLLQAAVLAHIDVVGLSWRPLAFDIFVRAF